MSKRIRYIDSVQGFKKWLKVQVSRSGGV